MTQIDENIDTNESPTTHESDRRALLRKMAIGGAGAAVAAVALGRTAEAVDGFPPTLGATNTATLPTIIDVTPATPLTQGPSALSVGGFVPAATFPAAAAVGGYGDATIPNGVHGSTGVATGFGVVAANTAPGGAQVLLATVTGAVAGAPAGTHVAGELYRDLDGTLWFSVPTAPGATTVKWVQLASTAGSGSFHAITPQRAYDSRQAGYVVTGPLAPNASRVVSVADGHSPNGTVTVQNAVPAGATAVEINLTAADPTDKNFLAVAPGDATSTATSLLNWNLGVTQIANSITVKLDADRKIKVFCGDQAGSTQFIVDVFGYYI